MSNVFRELAKQRPEPQDEKAHLRCKAYGCPLPWTVSPSHLCSYHAWEDPKNWPRITEELRRDGPYELRPGLALARRAGT